MWRRFFGEQTRGLISRRHDFALMKKIQGKNLPSWRQIRFITKILPAKQRIAFQISLFSFIIGSIVLLFGILSLFRVPVAAVGGKYVEGTVGSPRFVNPIFATINEVDTSLVRLVFSSLMRYDGKQQLITDLADSIVVSPDKKNYTFSLNRNARWHDNEPVTARDVVFTFELIQDGAVGSPLFNSFQGVTVSTSDDYTVQFTLAEPYPGFLAALTVGILPEHVWSTIPRQQIRLAEANLKPVGSGPYQFKRFIKESDGFLSRYELDRAPQFYRHPPFIENFIFQFYGSYEGDGGALDALRSQKIDGLSFVPTTSRTKISQKHVKVADLQVPEYTALFFNQSNNPAFVDKDIRQALSLAINKSKILQETLKDGGSIIEGPVLPGFPGFTSQTASASSPDQANALLDKKWKRETAENYKQGLREKFLRDHPLTGTTTTSVTSTFDAETSAKELETFINQNTNPAQLLYRQAKDGKTLTIRLVTADTFEYRHTAELIAGYWQDIGVKTDIEYVNTKDITRLVLKNRSYDVLLFGIIVGGEPDQYLFWHSTQINYPGLNLARYANKKVDEILLKIRQTNDADQLDKLYGDFQKYIIDDVPAIFLYSPTYSYALGSEIKGFGVERIAHPSDRFADVSDWYIKTKGEWKLK